MKKQLLFSLVFALNLSIVFAQHRHITLSGIVVTADGLPAPGLTVSVKNTKNITSTDREGAFSISAPIGNSVLLIKSVASRQQQEVAVMANTDKVLGPISIKEKSYELSEVVVTAQYAPQSVKNSVYNVRTINAEKIKLRGATNIQQILNTEFGFRFSNDMALGISDVELMGMTGRNIKILLDGVPVVDRSDARESLNQIDINTVERIEVVEGPISVVYGTDALAGVINIITKKAGKSLLNVSARVQEETAGTEYEALSGNGIHNKNLTVSGQKNGWNALFGVSKNDFGGWNLLPKTASWQEVNANNGNAWKPKAQLLGNAKLGYRNSKFNVWYRVDGLKENIDSRGGINMNNYKAELQTFTTNRYTQQLQSEFRVSNQLDITAIAGYTYLRRFTRTLIHDYATNISEPSTEPGKQDTANFNAAIFRATAQYVPHKVISFQPGFEFNRDEATGKRINGEPVIMDYAFFISSEIKPIAAINIRPGVRFIHNSVYDAPTAIPSLNTKFVLSSSLDFRVAYARGFRSPALRELYYDFVDASHTIYGNPNLKAEESNSFNASLVWAGIQRDKIQFRATLAGFYNQLKNRIGFGQDPNDNTVTTLINIAKYKTTGVNLDNTFIYDELKANVGISYVGRYNELRENYPGLMIPEFVWSAELVANLSYVFTKIGTNVSLHYKYAGSRPGYQYRDGEANLTKIGAFNWADLMLNKNVFSYLTLNAGVKNLFNVNQLSNTAMGSSGPHGGGGGAVSYSYGRSYVLGLTFNWNKP